MADTIIDFKNEEIIELDTANIVRGYYQPREYFDPEAMEATRKSIQEKGQMYPVIVRLVTPGNVLFKESWNGTAHYELADGERRFRCISELKLPKIKAIIRDLSDEQMLDYTLSTNDSLELNPLEKARVYFRLAEEFGRTQAEIADSFNIKQQQVSEYIRLLEAPSVVQDFTARGIMTVRHAREILKLSDDAMKIELANEVAEKKLSTRKLTEKIKNILEKDKNIAIKEENIERNAVLGLDIAENIEKIDKKPKKSKKNTVFSDDGITKDEIEQLFGSYIGVDYDDAGDAGPAAEQPKVNLRLVNPVFDFLGQLNALILYGKSRLYIRNYLKKLGNTETRPENFLAFIELCVILPSLALFALAVYYPLAAGAIGAFALSLLLLHTFEKSV